MTPRPTADPLGAARARLERVLDADDFFDRAGKVREVGNVLIRGVADDVKVGEICRLRDFHTGCELETEVIGFDDDALLMTPIGTVGGLTRHTMVRPSGDTAVVPVGRGLLGRILDGRGQPLDGAGLPAGLTPWNVHAAAPNPMTRRVIDRPFSVGVRAIDGLLTCGEGQRMGIFASAGGGKSTLMSMLVHGGEADVVVVALIGERGREVREFIEGQLGEDGLKKSVIFVATADAPAMLRIRAAYAATAQAEYFRDRGLRVLFLMDSVTRFARAAREIGLAAGEPPTRNGFPPSVFVQMPKLLERTGCSATGSITAFYTVLVEGDDFDEPVADEVRSLLDGHIILSQELGAAGHYPAIDVLRSKSRVMPAIVEPPHLTAATRMRELIAKYKEIELLIKVGEYQEGSDPVADEAILRRDDINRFLQQDTGQVARFADTLDQIGRAVR